MPVTNAQDMAKAGSLINSDGTTVSVAADLLIADKLVHTGDTNTAIRFPANDTVTVETSGTERMRIDSSGRVGIGTSSPDATLQVARSTSQTDIDGVNQVATFVNTSSDTSGNLTGIRLRQDNATNAAQGFIGLSSTGNVATRANLVIATPNTSGNATERLLIDSSGKILINGASNTYGGTGSLSLNAPAGSAVDLELRVNNTLVGYLYNDGTNVQLANAQAGYLSMLTSNTERLRIDSSGNLNIGSYHSGGNGGRWTSEGELKYRLSTSEGVYGFGTAGMSLQTTSNHPIVFGTNATERLRITSGGNVGINITNPSEKFVVLESGNTFNCAKFNLSASSGFLYGPWINFSGQAPNNNNSYFLYCNDTANEKCIIYATGTISNRTGTYNSLSDLKAKQDISSSLSQWNDIKALRVVKYRLKDEVAADPNYPYYIGLIAQEVEQISPHLVDQSPDYENVEVVGEDGNTRTERRHTGTFTKSVKTSILYMKAVKALQEAMERIEQLESKVAALEGA